MIQSVSRSQMSNMKWICFPSPHRPNQSIWYWSTVGMDGYGEHLLASFILWGIDQFLHVAMKVLKRCYPACTEKILSLDDNGPRNVCHQNGPQITCWNIAQVPSNCSYYSTALCHMPSFFVAAIPFSKSRLVFVFPLPIQLKSSVSSSCRLGGYQSTWIARLLSSNLTLVPIALGSRASHCLQCNGTCCCCTEISNKRGNQ